MFNGRRCSSNIGPLNNTLSALIDSVFISHFGGSDRRLPISNNLRHLFRLPADRISRARVPPLEKVYMRDWIGFPTTLLTRLKRE
ncbi:hypothetical protein Ccrd_001502 [Cynara cardunculus var. scolymus]|uniref:Uncharacterized protein n=1 Tax=Cynara cardunculus var. scolymus TaxID=59895 RepID=A0A103XT43_CYNCS|nr:hypothetical protein Ccrd_001502 [Cynara cardunculus var. scolymus]